MSVMGGENLDIQKSAKIGSARTYVGHGDVFHLYVRINGNVPHVPMSVMGKC